MTRPGSDVVLTSAKEPLSDSFPTDAANRHSSLVATPLDVSAASGLDQSSVTSGIEQCVLAPVGLHLEQPALAIGVFAQGFG